MFSNRDAYRNFFRKQGLVSFTVTVKETNLNIQATTDLTGQALRAILTYRQHIETHIAGYPEFAKSFAPLPDPGIAPAIITAMSDAAKIAGTGPMAAVAGAMAQFTGQALLKHSNEVVVENGGDIFVASSTPMTFGIYAPNSALSMKAGIQVDGKATAYGICTSSGTLGHSKSFGRADAATVLADDCALADAAATALGNRVQTPEDIEPAIAAGRSMKGVRGIVIILGSQIGLWGDLKLVRL